MVALPLVGGCQCGELRYEISQPPLMIYNCHCTNCRKIGGGAFATPLTVMEASFAFTQGEPRTFEWASDAGNRRFGWFCGDCATYRTATSSPTLIASANRRRCNRR